MKKILFSIAFGLLLVSVNAQLKVQSTGRVDISNQQVITLNANTDGLDIVNTSSSLTSGMDLIWANYSNYQYNNPGLLRLSYQYYTKFLVKRDGKVGICNSNPSYNLDITGNGRVTGTWTVDSDERLKANVSPLTDAKISLLKLNAVTYNIKTTPELFAIEVNGSKSIYKDSIEMKVNEPEPEFFQVKHIGFIAQDVVKVFPELVFEDNSGLLSLDYIGLIPVIVESFKDQDKLLTQQSIKITDLEARISNLEKILNIDGKKSSPVSIDDVNEEDIPFLSQNLPNPFDQQTEIAYYLTESTLNAKINIYNMNGKPVKIINLTETGQGVIIIEGSELPAGMYLYSLIADGVIVDTKQMILTD